ncbi:hypothetical protein DXG01_003777 [Tephrocybe rancida]|nr:hypothetical protein DXG01_003777 [Tephrocybe rancida]
MVLGFIRHILRYFSTDDRDKRGQLCRSRSLSPRRSPRIKIERRHSFVISEHVPLFDPDGRIVGYVRQPKTILPSLPIPKPLPPHAPIPTGLPAVPAPPAANTAAHARTLYTRNELGHFVPVIQTMNAPAERDKMLQELQLSGIEGIETEVTPNSIQDPGLSL